MEEEVYEFECYPMVITEHELGVPSEQIENNPIMVYLKLSLEEVNSIVEMLHWAWQNQWFEDNVLSDRKWTEWMKMKLPDLFDKVYPKVHAEFCKRFPVHEGITDWGVYEIYPPDDIFCMAMETKDDCSLDPNLSQN